MCWTIAAVVAGCGGELAGPHGDAAGLPSELDASLETDAGSTSGEDAAPARQDAGAPLPSLAIVSPPEGARFVRDAVVDGEWVARIDIEVAGTPPIASVDLVADGSFDLGAIAGASGTLSYAFHGDGTRTIAAIGRDASGAEIARDEVTITIEPPADASCHAMLDALGLDWEIAPPTRGIADPVRVRPTIAGVRYRYVSSAEPTPMLMDCELAPRLVRLSEIVREYGIDEVIHIGIYNYRCIGGGDPDSGTCTPSQHAYARAIDLHAFGLAGSDAQYSTETDFVITMRGDSCPIDSFSEPDRILKEIACRLWAERVFQIVLTPNYNDAHRNHYHVDLTEGAMYLGHGVEGVDPVVGGLGH